MVAYGRRAVGLSVACSTRPPVHGMATHKAPFAVQLVHTAIFAGGGIAYALIALVLNWVLDDRIRQLYLGEALLAFSRYIAAKAVPLRRRHQTEGLACWTGERPCRSGRVGSQPARDMIFSACRRNAAPRALDCLTRSRCSMHSTRCCPATRTSRRCAHPSAPLSDAATACADCGPRRRCSKPWSELAITPGYFCRNPRPSVAGDQSCRRGRDRTDRESTRGARLEPQDAPRLPRDLAQASRRLPVILNPPRRCPRRTCRPPVPISERPRSTALHEDREREPADPQSAAQLFFADLSLCAAPQPR